MKRLTVICDFYDRKDIGVDRFVFGEDFRPDMQPDAASIVDKKHVLGLGLKKKLVVELQDPIESLIEKMNSLKEKDKNCTNTTIANKFGELLTKPINNVSPEDLLKLQELRTAGTPLMRRSTTKPRQNR